MPRAQAVRVSEEKEKLKGQSQSQMNQNRYQYYYYEYMQGPRLAKGEIITSDRTLDLPRLVKC